MPQLFKLQNYYPMDSYQPFEQVHLLEPVCYHFT